MEVLGVGDAHLDKLTGLIPDASAKTMNCWRKVYRYALERGIKHVIHYGDIGDKSRLSDDAQCQLLKTILDPAYRELHLHFILGNHDFAESGAYSLRFLEVIAKSLNINLSVYSKQEVVRLNGVRFNMLPYPFTETMKDAVNVGHFEVAGSLRDNGRKIDDGVDNKHFCLMGHLHTPHQVRNTFYSGTLFQTNFGESMPKFFHHVSIESPKEYDVQQVPFKPPWELCNLIVNSAKDLKSIQAEAHMLYKLFIKDGADIDIDAVLTKYPNVVKHNSFKSKNDLKQQIEEAWEFDGDLVAQEVEPLDDAEVVKESLTKLGFNDKKIRRGFQILSELKGA